MSYNVNYVSKIDNVELKDSNGSSITGTDASVSNYEDVFTLITPDKAYYNGSTLSDTNCATCVVACACNTANGWTSTKPTSGSYYVAKNKVNMAYKSLYNAPTTTSMTTNVLTSGTQTLISQGSQAYGISTMSTASTTYNVTTTGSEPLTCYKKKDSYFECQYNWSLEGEYDTSSFYRLDSIDCINKNESSQYITIEGDELSTLLENASIPLAIYGGRIDLNIREFSTPMYMTDTSDFSTGATIRTSVYFQPEMAATNGIYTNYSDHTGYISFSNAVVGDDRQLKFSNIGGTLINKISTKKHVDTSGFSVSSCTPGSTDSYCITQNSAQASSSIAGYVMGGLYNVRANNPNNKYFMNMQGKRAFNLNLSNAYSPKGEGSVMFESGGYTYYMANYSEVDNSISGTTKIYPYPTGDVITTIVHARPTIAENSSGDKVIKYVGNNLQFIYDGNTTLKYMYIKTNYANFIGPSTSDFYEPPLDYEFNYPRHIYNTSYFTFDSYDSPSRIITESTLVGDDSMTDTEKALRYISGCNGSSPSCNVDVSGMTEHFALYSGGVVYAFDGEGVNTSKLSCSNVNGIYYYNDGYGVTGLNNSSNFPSVTNFDYCYAKTCADGYTLYTTANPPTGCEFVENYDGETQLKCSTYYIDTDYIFGSNIGDSPYDYDILGSYMCAKPRCGDGYDYFGYNGYKYIDIWNDETKTYDETIKSNYCQSGEKCSYFLNEVMKFDNDATTGDKTNGYCYKVTGCAEGYELYKTLPSRDGCYIVDSVGSDYGNGQVNPLSLAEVACNTKSGYGFGNNYCLKSQCPSGSQYFTSRAYDEFVSKYFSTSGCSQTDDGEGYCCTFTGCASGYVRGDSYDGNAGVNIAPNYCEVNTGLIDYLGTYEERKVASVDCKQASGYILPKYQVSSSGVVSYDTDYHSGGVWNYNGQEYYCMNKPCSDEYYFYPQSDNYSYRGTNGAELEVEVNSSGEAKEYCYKPIGCVSPYASLGIEGPEDTPQENLNGQLHYSIVDKGYYNCSAKSYCPYGYFYSHSEEEVLKRWGEYDYSKYGSNCYKINKLSYAGYGTNNLCANTSYFKTDYIDIDYDLGKGCIGAKDYYWSGYEGEAIAAYYIDSMALCPNLWSNTTLDQKINIGYSAPNNSNLFCHMTIDKSHNDELTDLAPYDDSKNEWVFEKRYTSDDTVNGDTKHNIKITLGIMDVTFDDYKLFFKVNGCKDGYTEYNTLPNGCTANDGILDCEDDPVQGDYNYSGAGIFDGKKILTGYNSSCNPVYEKTGTFCINSRATGLTAPSAYTLTCGGQACASSLVYKTSDIPTEISDVIGFNDTNNQCFKYSNLTCKEATISLSSITSKGYTKTSTANLTNVNGSTITYYIYTKELYATEGSTGTGSNDTMTLQRVSYVCDGTSSSSTCCDSVIIQPIE